MACMYSRVRRAGAACGCGNGSGVRAQVAGRTLKERQARDREVTMSEGQPDQPIYPPARKKTSLEELVRAKRARPITSMDEFVADTFDSDEELDEFIAFTHAERQRELA